MMWDWDAPVWFGETAETSFSNGQFEFRYNEVIPMVSQVRANYQKGIPMAANSLKKYSSRVLLGSAVTRNYQKKYLMSSNIERRSVKVHKMDHKRIDLDLIMKSIDAIRVTKTADIEATKDINMLKDKITVIDAAKLTSVNDINLVMRVMMRIRDLYTIDVLNKLEMLKKKGGT
jgi:hypothetical protein